MKRDYRDITGGMLLIAAGLSFTLYTLWRYELGTLRQMGPGMMPTALGLVVAGLGAVMIIPALRRTGVRQEIRIRSPLYVLLSVSSFAILIQWAGLLPAVVASTVISSFADDDFRPARTAYLSVVLCVIAWIVFKVGLGLSISMFRWPF